VPQAYNESDSWWNACLVAFSYQLSAISYQLGSRFVAAQLELRSSAIPELLYPGLGLG
jgi:hypothetical protein